MLRPFSLRTLSFVWVGLALTIGLVASYVWVNSNRMWDRHLANAYVAGIETYYALLTQSDIQGVNLTPLTPTDLAHANQGNFNAISQVPKPGYLRRHAIATLTQINQHIPEF